MKRIPDATELASMIDHTLLKADASRDDMKRLCAEAVRYGFASVCVLPARVAYCAGLLEGTAVRVCTVVGFPLGAASPLTKSLEARDAVAAGADELDAVMNVGFLKDRDYRAVFDDLRAVREATPGRVLKVIVETALLTREEKIRAALLALYAGADFVKTSTGFAPSGATPEDVRLLRRVVKNRAEVKASGGIRTREDALAMLRAGATRLGTSAGTAIVSDGRKRRSVSSGHNKG